MHLDAHNCGFMDFYFLFWKVAKREESFQRNVSTIKKARIVASVACCRLLSDFRGGGGKYEFASADCGLRIGGTDMPSGCLAFQESEIVRRLCHGRQQGGKPVGIGGKGFSILLGNLQGVGISRLFPGEGGHTETKRRGAKRRVGDGGSGASMRLQCGWV
jgi:hypothetical protein